MELDEAVGSVSSPQAERNQLAGEIRIVEAHLNEVAGEIRKVEGEIEKAETEWLRSDSSAKEFWAWKMKALREKDRQLREEKNKLREKEIKLREKENILLKKLPDSGGEFSLRGDLLSLLLFNITISLWWLIGRPVWGLVPFL